MQHAFNVPRPWRAGGGKGARRWPRSAAEHGGHTAGQGLFNLLGRDEVDVGVDGTGSHDHAFARNNFRARANDDVHTRLGVGVARFANGSDAGVFDTNIGFDNAPMVKNERVGQHTVHGTTALCAAAHRTVAGALALRHAVANGFAATKLHLFAIAACAQGVVLLDFNEQVGVGQAQAVAHGGAKHFGIGPFFDLRHHASPFNAPCTSPRKP